VTESDAVCFRVACPLVYSTSFLISGILFSQFMSDQQSGNSLSGIESYPSPVIRWIRALSSLNLNTLRVLLRNGPSSALTFTRYSSHLYTGFGMPHPWYRLPWRDNLQVPSRKIDQIFPEIDFSRSDEVFYPFPRDLGVLPQELIVLNKVVDQLQAKLVVEFGTAEGRTTLNIAAHLPPDGEIITLDLPPVPGKNVVGSFFADQPQKARIKQVFVSVDSWDFRPFRASAEIVFCDACDLLPGLAAEAYQAFSLIQPGGVIFRHDYSSAEGPTKFWNWLATQLPVAHIEGTCMLCLRVDSEEVYKKTQALLEHPLLKNSINIPGIS
jgi:hypothetical protein